MPFPLRQGGLPRVHQGSTERSPERRQDGGWRRSEGAGRAQRMGEGETGWMETGRPGAPFCRAGPPQPAGGPRSTAESPSVLSPCSNGSGRKQLNPMYFYTQHTPGQRPNSDRSLSMCMLWWGQDEIYVGKGLNTNKVAPSAHATEAARANYRQKSLGSISQGTKLLENTMKNNSPAKLQEAPLWASSPAFPGPWCHWGCWEQYHPFPSLLRSGLSSCPCALPRCWYLHDFAHQRGPHQSGGLLAASQTSAASCS